MYSYVIIDPSANKQSNEYFKFLKEGKNTLTINCKEGITSPAVLGIAIANKYDYKMLAK